MRYESKTILCCLITFLLFLILKRIVNKKKFTISIGHFLYDYDDKFRYTASIRNIIFNNILDIEYTCIFIMH